MSGDVIAAIGTSARRAERRMRRTTLAIARSEVAKQRRSTASDLAFAFRGKPQDFAMLRPLVCARASRLAVRDVVLCWLNLICLLPVVLAYTIQLAVWAEAKNFVNLGILVLLGVVVIHFTIALMRQLLWIGSRNPFPLIGTLDVALVVLFAITGSSVASVGPRWTAGHVVYQAMAVGSPGILSQFAAWTAVLAEGFGLYGREDVVPLQRSQLDRAFITLLRACGQSSLRGDDRRWADPSHAKELKVTLRRAARLAERAYLGRSNRWDRQARRDARMAGLQLAELIRAHLLPITTASDPQAYRRVTQSLADGVRRWALDDVDDILQNAPAVSLPSRFKRAIRRVVPPLILGAGAVALPLVPQIASVPGAVAGVRITLVSAAVLSLFGSAISPSEQIMGLIGKATSFGSKS